MVVAMKCGFTRLKKILLLILLVSILFYIFDSQSNTPTLEGFIHSAYYFKTSKSLGKNALAVVLTAKRRTVQNEYKLQVVGSKNKKIEYVDATVTIEPENSEDQFVTALIQSNLETESPGIVRMISDGTPVTIPFNVIDSRSIRSYPVVFCIAHPKFNHHWLEFLVQVHTAKYFGAHLHLYLSRVPSPFYELIQEYEKRNYISTQAWFESHGSNNGAAFTDCILQFKELTDYVVFLESDEILIPSGADSYYEEFMREFNGVPEISSLKYEHYEIETNIEESWNDFGIRKMIEKGTNKKSNGPGRLVARTGVFNSTGSKFSVNANRNNHRYTKRVKNGVLRIKNVKSQFSNGPFSIPNAAVRDIPLITEHQLDSIESNWIGMRTSPSLKLKGERLSNWYSFNEKLKNCLSENTSDSLECKDLSLIRSSATDLKCFTAKPQLRCDSVEEEEPCSLDFSIRRVELLDSSECFRMS